MLSSLTWGVNDSQIIDKYEGADGSAPSRKSRKERQSKTSEVPQFERLMNKLTNKAPHCIPRYNIDVLFPSAGLNFSWDKVSLSSHAVAGGLDELRANRKTQQIDNLLSESCCIIENRLTNTSENIHIIEFCGGAGYVAIPIADFYRY